MTAYYLTLAVIYYFGFRCLLDTLISKQHLGRANVVEITGLRLIVYQLVHQ